MPDPSSHSDPYALWRSANYRQYAGSWFLITFSRRVEFIAIGVYLTKVFTKDQAALALGVMGFVQAIPVMLLAIPGGQLADRYNRHRVMMFCFFLGIVSSACILALVLVGDALQPIAAVGWLYGLLVVGTIGWALGGPARQAMLPQLVPSELFSIGVAWNSSVFYTASVTGPVVGGFLMAAFENLGPITSTAPAFALVLVCRIIAIAAIWRIRYRPAVVAKTSFTWESVVAGIRFVWGTKLILATITLDLFAVLLGGATYLLPIYAKDILKVGPMGLGMLQSADAIGAIFMAVFLAHRTPLKRAGATMLWAVAGFGAATIVFGVSQWFWLSLLMMFLIGVLDNISVVVRHTLVQMLTPDEMRGRVSAVNGVFIVASNDLGGMESGLTSWLVGPVWSVVGGGIGALLVVFGVSRLWPEVNQIGSLGSIQPISPEEDDREA